MSCEEQHWASKRQLQKLRLPVANTSSTVIQASLQWEFKITASCHQVVSARRHLDVQALLFQLLSQHRFRREHIPAL